MSYMDQQMQQHIEHGISEAERCYREIAELKAQVEQFQQELSAEQEMVSNYHDTNSALAAQVEHLRSAIKNTINKWEGVTELESTLYVLMRFYNKSSEQCLAEHDAVVGRKAFIAGVNATGQGYNGELGLSDDEIIDLAELYVSRKIRQQARAGE